MPWQTEDNPGTRLPVDKDDRREDSILQNIQGQALVSITYRQSLRLS